MHSLVNKSESSCSETIVIDCLCFAKGASNVWQRPYDRRTHRVRLVLPYALIIKIRHIKGWFCFPKKTC
nr:MAG TPA: hypothetical protein [Caudoviricetes sp.]